MNFKGGTFINRYRIEGTLTTQSPLHIGDGNREKKPARFSDTEETPEYSTVIKDIRGRAYIPGSSLKGTMRSWTSQLFTMLGLSEINTQTRGDALNKLSTLKDNLKDNFKALKKELKIAEFLFGSTANEGKLEFWDAPMQTPPAIGKNEVLSHAGYDAQSGTILFKSVAIDPATGTAADKKLYNYEAVPKGASFKITICAQNLIASELGMLLFALDGFNSVIYPLTLGAMAGIGYGRCSFAINTVYSLDQDNLEDWLGNALNTGHAGYNGLSELDAGQRQALVEKAKTEFSKKIQSTKGE